MTETPQNNTLLPTLFVDAHQHFLDTTPTGDCRSFNSFLASIAGNDQQYLPDDYERDVVRPISNHPQLSFCGAVHVEAMPDNGMEELTWLTSSAMKNSMVKAIIASCDLTQPRETVIAELSKLKECSPLVRGIRWILDVSHENDQEYVPGTVTHIGTTRHSVEKFGTINYLQVPSFEEGFGCLDEFGLSFDLQCSPYQLPQAAKILRKYPNVPVCINHFGSLRYYLRADDKNEESLAVNHEQIELWKHGMEEISKLPQVTVKLSMLGRVVPDWHTKSERQQVLKGLLELVLGWFGPHRCIAALNWYLSPSISDSSGEMEEGPNPLEWIIVLSRLLPTNLSQEERNAIFAKNALRFYGIGD